MCGGGDKDVTVQNTNQEQQYKPAGQNTFKDITARAKAAANLPYTPVTQGVADLTPGAMSAIGSISGAATSPYMTSAAAHFENASQPLDQNAINQYFNPYKDQILANLQEVFGQQNRDEMGKMTQAAGGIGADRLAVARGELSRQQTLGAGQTLAQVYQNALQAAQNQQGIEQASAYGLGNLSNQELNANMAALQANMMPWQIEQMKQNAKYEEQMRKAGFPYAQSQFYAGLALPAAGAMGGTTTGSGQQTVNPPDPNPWSQVIGGATAGAAIGGPWGALAGAGLGAVSGFAQRGGRIRGYAAGGSPYGGKSYIPDMQMPMSQPMGGMQMPSLGFMSSPQQQSGGVGGKGSNIQMPKGNGIFDGFSVGSPEEDMGWSTNVKPSGMGGWGNFASNLFSASGGRVEDNEPYQILSRIARGKGGEVERESGGRIKGYAAGGSPFFSPALGGAPIFLDEEPKLQSRLEDPDRKQFYERLFMEGDNASQQSVGRPNTPSSVSEFMRETAMPKTNRRPESVIAKTAFGEPVASGMPAGFENNSPIQTGGGPLTPQPETPVFDQSAPGDPGWSPFNTGATTLSPGGPNERVAMADPNGAYLPGGGGDLSAEAPSIAHEQGPAAGGTAVGGAGSIDSPYQGYTGDGMVPPIQAQGDLQGTGEGRWGSLFGGMLPGMYQTPTLFGRPMDNSRLALLAAGLGMLGGESPYFGVNVGQGAMKGIDTLKGFQQMDAERQARALNQMLEAGRLDAQEGMYKVNATDKLNDNLLKVDQMVWMNQIDQNTADQIKAKMVGEFQKSGMVGEEFSATSPMAGLKAPDLPEVQYPAGADPSVAVNLEAVPENPDQYFAGKGKAYGAEAKTMTDGIMKSAREEYESAVRLKKQLSDARHYLDKQPKTGFLVGGSFHDERVGTAKFVNTIARATGMDFSDLVNQTERVGNAESLIKLQTYMGFSLARTLGTREAMQVIQQALSAVTGGQLTPAGARNILYGVMADTDMMVDKYHYLQDWQRKSSRASVMGADGYFDRQVGTPDKYSRRVDVYKKVDDWRNAKQRTPEEIAEMRKVLKEQYLFSDDVIGQLGL